MSTEDSENYLANHLLRILIIANTMANKTVIWMEFAILHKLFVHEQYFTSTAAVPTRL